MALFDLPLDLLQSYQPERTEPDDFDNFWQRTLTEARQFAIDAAFVEIDAGLGLVRTFDVAFRGWGGHSIKGWLLLPRHAPEPYPAWSSSLAMAVVAVSPPTGRSGAPWVTRIS